MSLNLTSTDHLLELVTTGTGAIHVIASFIDDNAGTKTGGSQTTVITTATTTTIVSAPGASITRAVHHISVVGVASNTVTIHKDVASTDHTLIGPVTLGAGNRIEFTAAKGWGISSITAAGQGWDDVLAEDNTSGANNPTISAGQGLVVPGGQSAGSGDIRSTADISLVATTDVHIHAGGDIHVGHAGSTTNIHVEGETIELLTDSNGISISAATSANIDAGTSSTIQTATFFAVNATGQVVITTGGVERLEIEATGGWQVGGTVGSAGQVLKSNGAGTPPTWQTDSNTTYSAGDGLDLTVTTFSVDVSDFAGSGLEDDGAENLRIAAAAAGAGLTGGAGSALAVGAGTGITVNADDVQLATIAAESFFINGTAGAAVPTAIAGSTVAGAGLTYTTGGILAVGSSTSITVNANDVQRAALTGAITASANSNTTAFGTLAAKSVLANATNATAVPAALAGSAAFQYLRVNSGNTGLEWAVLSLSAFPSMAAGSFLANVTAGAAVPTAHDLTTFAGAGLTYTNVTGILAVGAGTGITVNANDVAITTAGVTPAMISVIASSVATTITIYASYAAGGGGAADDVSIFTSNAPFNFRITEVIVYTATAVALSTVTLRSATGGGGSALSSAISTTIAGQTSNNNTATTTVASGTSLVIRRSDSGVAGEVVIFAVKT